MKVLTGAEWAKEAARISRPSKYRNRVVIKNGERFDSTKEYLRHLVLVDMQKHGEIRSLKRQPKFVLIVNAVKVGEYWPDWRYYDLRKDVWVCEDAKGFQTPEFKLKWKLAKALYPEIDWRLS